MTQMATRVGSSTAPTGIVTVADLLTRYAPDPLIEAEPVTEPVSVGSLLRREGRAPHAQDRPLAPRSRSAFEEEQDEPRRGSGALVRRSAIAAGTLLAAGSVFGATVVMDSSSTESVDRPQTGYAGEGRLDLPQNQDRAIPTVVDTAAQTDQLDPGVPAPMAWSDVAFPRGASDGGQATTPDASRAPAAAPADQGGTAGQSGSTDDERDTGSTPGGSTDDAPSGNGGGSTPGGSSSGGSTSGDDGDTGLGSAVQDLGDDVGGPVGGVVSGLGSTVSAVGDLAGGLLS